MLKDLILFEFIKIKNSKILFIIFFFNIFSVLIGSVIYLSNLEFLKNENQLSLVLWGQCSLYSSQIFLPVLIGILCSISWQMEEKNKNWQRMKTIPISDFSFVFSKFLNIQVFNLISSIIYYLLFVISVILLGVPDTPFLLFFIWCIYGWLGTFPITALQLLLAIKFKNFTSPIVCSASLAIIGLATLFFGKIIFTIFPYTQINIGIRARVLDNFKPSEFIIFIIVISFYSFIGLFYSSKILKKRE